MKQIIAFALAMALALAGCAGSQPQNGLAGQPAQPQAQPASQAAPSAAAGQPASGASGDFARIMGMSSQIQYKVDYLVTIKSDLLGVAQNRTAEEVQYFKGGSFRADTINGAMQARAYSLSGSYYACTNTGGSWMCYSLPAQASAAEQAASALKSNPSAYMPVADGTMDIAGTTAACYRIDNVQNMTVRYCFSPEYVPLYIKTSGTIGGNAYESETVAKSYSTSVSDSDLALPATPQALPTNARRK